MKCNIDTRGRVVRLVWGILLVALSACAFVLAASGVLPPAAGFIGGGILFVFGALAVFEAAKGWCIMRAMGFRTPV